MPTDEPITLAAGPVEVDVEPDAGGRVAQIRVGDVPLLIGRGETDDPMRWGSYAMVPWAGRIRRGRFRFDGVDHQLVCNDPPHAIHGVGYTSTWSVSGRTAVQIRLTLDLPTDDRWPFGGRTEQVIGVDPRGVALAMSVVAERRPFPTSFGWHPWFRKPDVVDFHPTAMYRRDDDHVAVDELVTVRPGPWDDCFLNDRPVGIEIDGVRVTLTSDCRHWVVYDQPAHATCIEPQTAPPDAFNLGSEVVRPGRSGFARFRIEVGTDA